MQESLGKPFFITCIYNLNAFYSICCVSKCMKIFSITFLHLMYQELRIHIQINNT